MKRVFALILVLATVFCLPAFCAEYPDLTQYTDEELKELACLVAQEAGKRIYDRNAELPEEDFYYVSNGEVTRINHYQGNNDEIVIPEMLDGTPVTWLGEGAFLGAKGKNIRIPDTVTELGEDCLRSTNIPCVLILPAQLKETDNYITLNASFTGIVIQSDAPFYTWAFANTPVEFLYIREGCAPRFLRNCFDMCNKLEIAVIPPSVKEIADNTFEGCKLLKIITTPGSYAEKYARENFIRCETDTYDDYVALYESLYFAN